MQSEHLANILENTACQVAQLRAGRLNPHHLLPYLPVSLGMVCEELDRMVDGAAVQVEVRDGIKEYVFSEYTGNPARTTELRVSNCVACSDDLKSGDDLFCFECRMQMEEELSALSEKTGWPAQAVYEHEILYLASRETGSIAAETLAGASNYTLRSMKRKLATLAENRFVQVEPGDKAGLQRYVFPAMTYSKKRYRKHQQLIRSYPASLMEAVEERIVHILFALGVEFLVMLALAFWGFPFVLLVPAFLVSAPIVAFVIWRHKNKVKEF